MKVTQCPVHAIVLDAARAEMTQNQRFMKASVLQTTGLKSGSWTRHIQWPYIRATIEEELGGEVLQPISDANGQWDPHIHPEKFLPSAHRKTAGYVRSASVAPEISKKYLERRYNVAAGGWHGFELLATSYQKQGLIKSYSPVALPRPQL